MKKPQLSLLAVSVSIASLLLAPAASFANAKENYKGEAMPCPVELVLKDGLYLGVALGYDNYRIANSTVFSAPAVPATLSFDPRINANGIVGGGYIGYGKYFNELYGAYLGLEIFGNWSGAKSDHEVTIVSPGVDAVVDADYRVKSNYGIDVLPGVKLNNATLLYVRLGYNWARMDLDVDVTDNTGAAPPLSADSDKTRGGFHYGVGIESTFYDNWSVRAEYTHTGFSGTDSDDFDATGATGNTVTSSNSISDNQFMMGLSYHFNM